MKFNIDELKKKSIFYIFKKLKKIKRHIRKFEEKLSLILKYKREIEFLIEVIKVLTKSIKHHLSD